ncbi:Glycosyl transferase family 2 [Pedobacter terrae]|uniref:Glycosyl transferase family 2 n=1 Tax=Pedobacter terrae TaxID=405671 RepID=A0A1G7U3F6_9SPHI|nr:glycosyltransferase family 2 protein [Pedobacter terrae]SDG41908.1 Glycosyl transferase family 2 [Pedobacter terrae]
MNISIIIPTRNRALQLAETLESIAIQQLNNNIEVIVIDNGSNDNTKDMVIHFVKRIPNLIYKFDDMPGLLTGRHLGAEIASGEILCFLDDDVGLNPNYLKHLANTFSNNPSIHLATGPCLPKFEITPPKWLEYFWDKTLYGKCCSWLSLLDFGNIEIDISPMFMWGLNFCIRKSTLIDLGGFHPDCIPDHLQQFQGDGETGLASKAIKNGISTKYIPGLMLKHYVAKNRLTFEYFKRRAFYQGVCNSFTSLRITNNPQENIQKKRKEVKTIKKKLRDRLHPFYRWIKLLAPSKKKRLPKDIKILFDNLAQIEADGYNFHQLHFNNNRHVKDWVLKENYWDYKLPLNDR